MWQSGTVCPDLGLRQKTSDMASRVEIKLITRSRPSPSHVCGLQVGSETGKDVERICQSMQVSNVKDNEKDKSGFIPCNV
jgi:hypothetical protein